MNFVDAFRNAVRSEFCSYLALEDKGASFFNELSPIDIPNVGRYWRVRLCDENPADIPQNQPPFDGGQCDVDYDVTLSLTTAETLTSCTQNTRQETYNNIRGPIRGLRTDNETSRCGPGGFRDVFILHTNAQGNPTETQVIDGSSGSYIYSVEIVSVVRSDGQPDNCGNPPIEIPPFPEEGDDITINFTYEDNSGNNITLSPTLRIFAPVFVTPVNVYAPVSVDLGGIQFDGRLEFAPEFNFNFGQPNNTDGPGSGQPAPPENPDQAPTTPEDEDQRRLIGVIVRSDITGNFNATEIFQEDGVDLYVPRLANLYIRVRSHSGLAWLGPIDVKTRSFYYAIPESVFAVTARIDFEPGFSGSITLVWSDSQPNPLTP